MLKTGSIALHRRVFNKSFSPLKRASKFTEFEAWLWMIATAFFCCADVELYGDIITIPRGSFICTTLQLAETWKWSRRTVDRFLEALEKEGTISREKCAQKCTQIRAQKCTLVKINNYDDFQPAILATCAHKDTHKCAQKCTLNKKNIIKRNNKNIFNNSKKNFLNFFQKEQPLTEVFEFDE